MNTRKEHLQWCKDRALKYVEKGEIKQALASMASDVMKHEETKHHEMTNSLGVMQLIGGHLDTPEKMRKWINGYN